MGWQTTDLNIVYNAFSFFFFFAHNENDVKIPELCVFFLYISNLLTLIGNFFLMFQF